MKAHVVIRSADGADDIHPLDSECTLGRSNRAGIALTEASELEEEHLYLVPQDKGCWVSVKTGAVTPLLKDGRPMGDSVVPWGSALSLGRHTITLQKGAPRADGGAPSGGISTPTKVIAVLLMVVIAAMFAMRRRASAAGADGGGLEPTALFDTAPASCDADPAVAEHEAEESRRAARLRGERFYFDYQDGIEAARLYARAEACYRVAGRSAEAEHAAESGAQLRTRIDESYRRLRLRLVQTLDRGESMDALEAVRRLRELTRHRDDEYTRALAAEERSLQLDLGLIGADPDDRRRGH